MILITISFVVVLFICRLFLGPSSVSPIILRENTSKIIMQRYVAQRKCPKDCKNHTGEVLVYYHSPFGVIAGEGATEEEADKIAKIKLSEETAKAILTKTKELMELEAIAEKIK